MPDISIFITFEGGEGVGKSTQTKLLRDAFIDAGYDVVLTREPGGSKGAERIRALLVEGSVDKWTPYSELLMHTAARVDHVEHVIQPALKKGNVVICDRFVDSTIAYQAYGHELGIELVEHLHEMFFGDFYPDCTYVLDINPERGIKRTLEREDSEDRYEKMGDAFHTRVRNGFLDVAQKHSRCALIDANKSISSIHANIVSDVNDRFGLSLAPLKKV